MLCYVMIRYVMLYYVMSCHVMLCHVTLCCFIFISYLYTFFPPPFSLLSSFLMKSNRIPSPPPLPAPHTHIGITHGLISTPRMRALEMLKKFLKAKPEVVSALIFVNDPHRVEIIYEKLLEMGFIAAPLHGESSKDDRKVRIRKL